jgi:hypothetical protein
VLRFLADHNFNFDVVRGLRRRGAVEGFPIDVVTARVICRFAPEGPSRLDPIPPAHTIRLCPRPEAPPAGLWAHLLVPAPFLNA